MNKLKSTAALRPPPLPAAASTTTKSLNAAISRLSRQGSHRDALFTFAFMLKTPTAPPDASTYPSILKACASLGLRRLGPSLHQRVVSSGFSSDPYTSSSLINLYAKFNDAENARKVFDMMPQRNIVPWTAIIWCYSHAGDMASAFSMYNRMQREGIVPSSVTILNMLTGASDKVHVEILHTCVIKMGCGSEIVLMNCLLSVYAKCGHVENARELFESLGEKDIVSWNSLINAYSVEANLDEVLQLFCRMRAENVRPDVQTFGSLASAVARLGSFDVGRAVHGQIVVSGLESDKHVATSLFGFYSRCREVNAALEIFEQAVDKDVIFCTAVISGLVQNDSADRALSFFKKMLDSRVCPSAATMACVVAGCAQMGSIKLGTSVHCYILRQQFPADIPLQNSLISFYSKCGLLGESFTVFRMMERRDVVSWNSIIAGYSQNGHLKKALSLFQEMRYWAHQKPDSITFVSLLQACASIGAYHQGKWIHNFILRSNIRPCIKTGSALIDMYAKCGDLNSARKCFDRLPHQDAVAWSTIIAGYGSHGRGEIALQMYSEYAKKGFKPNDVIFLAVLYACSHNGLVDKGVDFFESIVNDHKFEPKIEHLACMVDLLCRGRRVEEAYAFYRRMFSEPVVEVLGIMLDACRKTGQEELGRSIAGEISGLRPGDAGNYVQLAHSFASMEKWESVGETWMKMRALGLRKFPGWSFVEMHGEIIPFFTGQGSNPLYGDVASVLRDLTDDCKRLGFDSEDEDFCCLD
ncbi:Pentatricopeptide repeat-containing protein [Striga hermonthica]|uniref:Pentatricopeptide repeat-containing protein n=1 Tax=Striga hermonthica TaxID=68872 RepID=A0A9N7RC41_STRHE|nr:Pentatricopeptide repeat-containing protein [Striga hermonthica]